MFHADTITYDEAEQMVYYENVRLDFFGIPIIWLPFFAHADPTAERKSGFLRPDYVLMTAIWVSVFRHPTILPLIQATT
jgi:LPS-assembly protein